MLDLSVFSLNVSWYLNVGLTLKWRIFALWWFKQIIESHNGKSKIRIHPEPTNGMYKLYMCIQFPLWISQSHSTLKEKVTVNHDVADLYFNAMFLTPWFQIWYWFQKSWPGQTCKFVSYFCMYLCLLANKEPECI